MLSSRGVVQGAGVPADQQESRGTVAEVRSAVLNGTSWYYIRLDGEEVFYAFSAGEDRNVIVLNEGDKVTIMHQVPAEGSAGPILEGYSLEIE